MNEENFIQSEPIQVQGTTLKGLFFKNKFQLFVLIYLFILLVYIVYARVSPTGIDRMGLSGFLYYEIIVWLPALFFLIVMAVSAALFVVKKIKKSDDYSFFKKVLIVLAELVILIFLMIYAGVNFLSAQTAYQRTNSSNVTKIIKGLTSEEISAVQALFPNGDPSKRENKILYMKKLDNACLLGDEFGRDDDIIGQRIPNCKAGQIVIEYGWNICLEVYSDSDFGDTCRSDHERKYYLLEKSENKWKIIGEGLEGGWEIKFFNRDSIGQTAVSTADETANWQTYKDPASGIEFKYPTGYFVTKEEEGSISLKTVEQSDIPVPAYMYVNYDKDNGYTTKGSSISFAEGTAIESQSDSDSGDFSTAYIVETVRGNTEYAIQFMNKTKTSLTVIDKLILSSFRFTK